MKSGAPLAEVNGELVASDREGRPIARQVASALSRLDPRIAATLLGAAAIGVLAWPVGVPPVSPGLDPSFIAGLHMAGARGMDVGVEIISTYGPLGFLSFPQPVYGFTNALALLHTAAIHFALVGILVHRSVSVLPLWGALALSYAGAQTIRWLGVPEMALVLSAIVAILAIERAAAGHPIPDWALGVAALCVAVLGLGKLNTGVVIVALTAVTVAAIGGRRQLLIYIGFLAAFAAVLWFAAGQGVANVLPFFSTSAAMISGFNSAMGLDQDQAAYWLVSAAGLGTAILVYARVEAVASWPPRLRLAVALVLVPALFITFKASFVRWHLVFIFATLVILTIATLTPRVTRRTGLLAVGATLIAFLGATHLDAWHYLDPTSGQAFAQRHTLLANAEKAGETRQALAAAYAVDESILSRIRGQSVHVGPLESGVAFAHAEIDWTPLPVYQDYHVFTPGLDDVNREFLRAPDAAPRFILRGPPVAIDGRYPWFEGPATMRAMLCLYHEVEVAGQWQLLQRGADRCAEPHLVSRVVTQPGVAVPVPRLEDEDAMMFVRITGLEPTIAEAAWSFLFKAHEWYITRNETDSYRFIAPTAGQGLLMSVGPTLAYTDGFGFGPRWRSVSVAPGPRSSVATTQIRLEFWGVRDGGADAE
jgi:hypothetical protein